MKCPECAHDMQSHRAKDSSNETLVFLYCGHCEKSWSQEKLEAQRKHPSRRKEEDK